MNYIKSTFEKLQELLNEVFSKIKIIINELSFSNIKNSIKCEYQNIRHKLADLKNTNWQLACYHFLAGNYNDAIVRLKILQKYHYKFDESSYLLGRIFLEKKNYIKAKQFLNAYIQSENKEFLIEAHYCIAVMNHQEVEKIPESILICKRNRIALNLRTSTLNSELLNHYSNIIEILKSEISAGEKILEIGCYIGFLGRILREVFFNNVQYLEGFEIGFDSAQVTAAMYINDVPVYNKINTDISNITTTFTTIIVPNILSIISNVVDIFVQIDKLLQNKGIALIVARVYKDESITNDIEFIHAIEEFRFKYSYLIQLGLLHGLSLKYSHDLNNGFEMFVFKKL